MLTSPAIVYIVLLYRNGDGSIVPAHCTIVCRRVPVASDKKPQPIQRRGFFGYLLGHAKKKNQDILKRLNEKNSPKKIADNF